MVFCLHIFFKSLPFKGTEIIANKVQCLITATELLRLGVGAGWGSG